MLCGVLVKMTSYQVNHRFIVVSLPSMLFIMFTRPRARNEFVCDHWSALYLSVETQSLKVLRAGIET